MNASDTPPPDPKPKRDARPQRYMWAPGKYLNTCKICSCQFIGDKRAQDCADCAYALPEPVAAPPDPKPSSVDWERLRELYLKANRDTWLPHRYGAEGKETWGLASLNYGNPFPIEDFESISLAIALHNSLPFILALSDELEKHQKALHEIASYIEPHYLGAGETATGAWLFDAIVHAGNRLEQKMDDLDEAKAALTQAQSRADAAEGIAKELLFAAECADETGYVQDVGFINLDDLHKRAHDLVDHLPASAPATTGRTIRLDEHGHIIREPAPATSGVEAELATIWSPELGQWVTHARYGLAVVVKTQGSEPQPHAVYISKGDNNEESSGWPRPMWSVPSSSLHPYSPAPTPAVREPQS